MVHLLHEGREAGLLVVVRVEVAQVGVRAHGNKVARVTAMLDFHTCIVAEVDVLTPRFLLGKVILHTHIHVESGVGLGLAVLHALDFVVVLGHGILEFDAIGLALLEEQLRQSVLLERSFLIVGVLGPVSGV